MIELDTQSRKKIRLPVLLEIRLHPKKSNSSSATLFVTLSDLNKTSNRAATHTYKMHKD